MNNEMIAKGKKYIMGTYSQAPIVIEKGEGVILTDNTGKEYIDMVSGIAVNSLGYGHPAVVKAIQEQAEKLIHISNLYWNVPQIELAEKLCQASGLGKAFFCNSGAEANESAIKLARKYGSKTGRHTIISMIQSFHGRTMGALKATGQTKYQNGFAPLPEGFKYTEANNIEMLDAMIDDDTCAIMLEVIQGEAGIIALDEAYLKHVEQVCAEKDILFIIDEVQTGVGRTGSLYCYEQYGIEPDVITSAKGLGGGLPIGACLCASRLGEVLGAGMHGTTFGGNPVSCAGGLEVLQRVAKDSFLRSVEEKGRYLREKLSKMAGVQELRGLGMMIGIVLAKDNAKEVAGRCVKNGLLVLTAKHKMRLLPPLNIAQTELEKGLSILKNTLAAL
mgnify:CR=1 FL=1